MKNDCLSEFFGVRAQMGFFQRRSADEVTLRVGLFLNVSCISSTDYRSKGGGDFEVS